MTFYIAIDSRARTNIADVYVTCEERFNLCWACIEGLRGKFHVWSKRVLKGASSHSYQGYSMGQVWEIPEMYGNRSAATAARCLRTTACERKQEQERERNDT